ncbi:M20/M25/M40 family metallo-hydrolase, partial [bacterium]|nr:M20/M25/M40 family metallo-hydrolase [candidate division CSSED10-310 bacterium]
MNMKAHFFWGMMSLFCISAAWCADVDIFQRIVVLPKEAGTAEKLLSRGIPVIGTVGESTLILDKNTELSVQNGVKIPVYPGTSIYVASSIDPDKELPVQFRRYCLYSNKNEYLLLFGDANLIQTLLEQRFEIRRIRLRPWTPITQRTPIKVAKDPDPLIQEMLDMVSLTNYQMLLSDLVAFGDRYSCSPGHGAQAAQYIYDTFVLYGYADVRFQDFDSCSDNVIARKTGVINPERIWVIGAHYDSYTTGNAPGADDNGSGTALVLEIARILQTYDFEDTIEFVLFASEELGLYGSDAYAEAAASAGWDIQGAICIDMVGYLESGDLPDIDVVDNTSSNWLEQHVFQSISNYLPGTAYKDSQLPFGASSDHASFWNYGYPAILLFEDYPDYSPYIHTSNDTIGTSVNSWDLAISFTNTALCSLAEAAVPAPREIYMLSHEINDPLGDGDGTADPGETVDLTVSVKNNLGYDATNVQMTLSCIDACQGVSLINDVSVLGTLANGTTASNDSDPFVILFSESVPSWTDVTFQISISADGGYSNMASVAVTVTAAEYVREYFWNMDVDPVWTVTGGSGNNRWQFGQPQGLGGQYGEPDPSSGYTGSTVYGYNLQGDYPS